jgi:S-DNA-T family DNA segregation ATPase FtsK/SpoIIIE
MVSKNFITSRFNELLGASFFIFAIFCILAFVTYHPLDPSITNNFDSEVYNKAGIIGSYFANFMLESFGLASIVIISYFAVWGFLFFKKENKSYFSLRITSLIITLCTFSFILSLFNTGSFWDFHSYGGVMGTFIKYHLNLVYPFPLWVILAVLMTFFGFCFSHSLSSQTSTKKIYSFLIYLSHKLYILIKNIPSFFKKLYLNIKLLIEKKFSKKRIKDIDSTYFKKTEKPHKKIEQENIPKVKQSDKFTLPSTSILKEDKNKIKAVVSKEKLAENANQLHQTLDDFGVNGKILNVKPGPVVTLYEFEPSPGIKSSRIIGLADDVARSMSAISARISVIAGQNALGIELPNEKREMVLFKELLESKAYNKSDISIPLALGKNIGGDLVMADLAKMPHLMVAGTTGSGKSVAINTMILSIIYKLTPDECKFIMVDPKMLELSVYDGIPHLLSPVVTDPKKAVQSLRWAVQEMENRYRLMSSLGVRNMAGYNEEIEKAIANDTILTRQVQTGFDPESGNPIFEDVEIEKERMPYIVIIIDEMADLMLVAGKEIEVYIQRLAQMARAAGIHLIIATQRPSVDVITGVIKANFPTRISFQVTSKIDSRTILGEQGAEQLLGMGDMLYMHGGSKVTRVHGPFVSDDEVRNIVSFLKKQAKPVYIDQIINNAEDNSDSGSGAIPGGSSEGSDDLYNQAVQIVLRDKKVSTSYVQRQLKIGYNRAANIIEKMESEGVISPPNATGRRTILTP